MNDYGRPFQAGVNGIAGFSTSGSAGILGLLCSRRVWNMRLPLRDFQVQQDAIQFTDQKPPQPAFSIPTFNQFRLLDTYVSLNLGGWQTSFGKQTLWLSPTRDPFLQSNNAEPMYMLRVDQTTPSLLAVFLQIPGPRAH